MNGHLASQSKTCVNPHGKDNSQSSKATKALRSPVPAILFQARDNRSNSHKPPRGKKYRFQGAKTQPPFVGPSYDLASLQITDKLGERDEDITQP